MEIDVYGREEFACIWALAVRLLPDEEDITPEVMRDAFASALHIYIGFRTGMEDAGGAIQIEYGGGVVTAHLSGEHLLVTGAKGTSE